jgi:hypothetical protein
MLCQLARPEHKLAAISDIVKIIQANTNDEYIDGLFVVDYKQANGLLSTRPTP